MNHKEQTKPNAKSNSTERQSSLSKQLEYNNNNNNIIIISDSNGLQQQALTGWMDGWMVRV